MKISCNWLKEYIPYDFSVEELAKRLTMIGLEVEDIYRFEPKFKGVVVGKILRIEDHPNADKLKVCSVDVGKEKLSIVCGAPNITEGQYVPVAKVGAVLGDAQELKSVTIRGVQSAGMICSEWELGLGENREGIFVLNKNTYEVGDDFLTDLPKEHDAVLEINVTPNRPDCLSHLGVAREVGAIVGKKFTKPEITLKETSILAKTWISVEIKDPVACPRYSARVIYDLKIAPSPSWLKKKLESVGIRSINNVVDITNYVLMETGHPLHAFDHEFIHGKKIIVRKAEAGEEFITLDEKKHRLTKDDLLICDAERAIAIAGVMGGLNSEVQDTTTTVVLESAYFDPFTIRKTAKRLGYATEASQRFERGTDPNNTLYAVHRASQLFTEIAGGKVAQGVIDEYPQPLKEWDVVLRPSRVSKVLGCDIPKKKMLSILENLGLAVAVEGNDSIRVTVPTFRHDLKQEIDLIEELIRHYGFDKIEPQKYVQVPLKHPLDEQNATEEIRDILVGLGFQETLNNSMVSEKHVFSVEPNPTPVVVQNPLSPENAFLRTSLIPGLLDAVQWNKNRSIHNLRFFEIGKIFQSQKKSLPKERLAVAGTISGLVRFKPFWGEKDTESDFFHLKGMMEVLFERLKVEGYELKPWDHASLKSDVSLAVFCGSKTIGYLGEMKKSVLEQWDITDRVFVFEIFLQDLNASRSRKITFSPIPKFPSIKRDLALIVDENIPIRTIKEHIQKKGGKKLVSVGVFDLYKGPQVPSGKKSVAISLTFISPSRTLKEKEIDPIMASIVKTLKASLNASLRS